MFGSILFDFLRNIMTSSQELSKICLPVDLFSFHIQTEIIIIAGLVKDY